MNKKAIIFTVDAGLAVLIAIIMITVSYFHLSPAEIDFNRPNLHKISLDALAVLEKNGALKNSVDTSSTAELQDFLDSLPPQMCGNLTVFDQNSVQLLSTQSANCDLIQPVFSRRVFVTDTFSVYYAESKLDFR